MAEVDAMRAMALVGTPFRPQGRDSKGLDCIGLCLEACGMLPSIVRSNYRLRGDYRAEAKAILNHHFRRLGRNKAEAGDLILMKVSDDQLHVGILTSRGFVHADARLRRVVETPGDPPWPLLGIYRRRRQAAY